VRRYALCRVHTKQFLEQQKRPTVRFDLVLLHVLLKVAVGIAGALEIRRQLLMLGHLAQVLPVFVRGKAHHVENPVQLILVVRVAGFYVLLSAVENRFRGEQFGENAT